jgi:hypothetical protein
VAGLGCEGVVSASDAVGADAQRSGIDGFAHVVQQFPDLCAGLLDGAGVYPEDAVGAEAGDEAGHGAAGAEGADDVVEWRYLLEYFVRGEAVAVCADGVRPADRDDRRSAALPA